MTRAELIARLGGLSDAMAACKRKEDRDAIAALAKQSIEALAKAEK